MPMLFRYVSGLSVNVTCQHSFHFKGGRACRRALPAAGRKERRPHWPGVWLRPEPDRRPDTPPALRRTYRPRPCCLPEKSPRLPHAALAVRAAQRRSPRAERSDHVDTATGRQPRRAGMSAPSVDARRSRSRDALRLIDYQHIYERQSLFRQNPGRRRR